MKKNIFIILLAVFSYSSNCQTLYGTVSDVNNAQPLSNVIIINKSIQQSVETDQSGNFTIQGTTGDTLIFSLFGYQTIHKIARKDSFLNIKLDALNVLLKEHTFKDYSLFQKDSIELTTLYSKELNLAEPKMGFSNANGGGFTGVIGTPIKKHSKEYKRAKQFKENFQKDIEQKFIDTRYTPSLVQNLTSLTGDSLFMFINSHPMDYNFARSATDLELKMWIRDQFKKYKNK